MSSQIEHFVYGTRGALERFSADLPAGIGVATLTDGLMLSEVLGDEDGLDAAIARMQTHAEVHGVTYDGYGRCVDDAIWDGSEAAARDLQLQTFTARTDIKAGHGFAVALRDGRFGHAIHMGSDRRGYLLLQITALVTDRPASPDDVRDAPMLYRQPIIVWHTPFAVLPLSGTKPLAQLPCEVLFRCSMGWPAPQEVARLESQFALSGTDTPEGWNALLVAIVDAGERLPGLLGYSVWTARAARSGMLKLIEDYATHPFSQTDTWPMPSEPADMDEITAILAGARDMIAVRDKVT